MYYESIDSNAYTGRKGIWRKKDKLNEEYCENQLKSTGKGKGKLNLLIFQEQADGEETRQVIN